MKHFVKYFVVTLTLLFCTYAYSEQKVVVLDMKYILNNSKAGKQAQDFLKSTFEKNQKDFLNREKDLKKDEKELLDKKDTLSKEDYKKLSDELRKKVIKYQADRRSSLDKIAKQRADARKKLVDKITPIVQNYIKENNVSVVIDKKYVVGGNKELDITTIITDKLNKELPSLKLQ